MSVSLLREARAELYDRSEAVALGVNGWDEYAQYIRFIKGEGIDVRQCQRFCGLVAVLGIVIDPPVFEFHDGGEAGVVIEVLGDDSETIIDLCAWSLVRPEKHATMFGNAIGLGGYQIANPATYFAGQHLQVHRTPLAWLKAGCAGVVILNRIGASDWLGSAKLIAAEDQSHGRELAKTLRGVIPPDRILIPRSTIQAAA